MRRLIFTLLAVVVAAVTYSASAVKPKVVELKAGATLPAPTKKKAVVVDFNAVWCVPCHAFKPVFERAAKEFGTKAQFVSVNVDECGTVAKEYGVRSIPYVVVLLEGREPVTHVGMMSYEEFAAFLTEALN